MITGGPLASSSGPPNPSNVNGISTGILGGDSGYLHALYVDSHHSVSTGRASQSSLETQKRKPSLEEQQGAGEDQQLAQDNPLQNQPHLCVDYHRESEDSRNNPSAVKNKEATLNKWNRIQS